MSGLPSFLTTQENGKEPCCVPLLNEMLSFGDLRDVSEHLLSGEYMLRRIKESERRYREWSEAVARKWSNGKIL